jgi:iron complex outermembrane receptor protein
MDEPQRKSVILSFLCLLLGAAPLPGQTGTIVGRVVGPDSARPIVGALVEARDAVKGESRSVLTNLEGAFRIAELKPASYTMRVAAVGYGTQAADTVQVMAGVTVTVSIMLEPRAMELNPVVVTSSRRTEKALEAPAHVEILAERDIEVRPALSMADHLRATTAVDVVTGGLQTTRVVVAAHSSFSGSCTR